MNLYGIMKIQLGRRRTVAKASVLYTRGEVRFRQSRRIRRTPFCCTHPSISGPTQGVRNLTAMEKTQKSRPSATRSVTGSRTVLTGVTRPKRPGKRSDENVHSPSFSTHSTSCYAKTAYVHWTTRTPAANCEHASLVGLVSFRGHAP